jgi:hypothetical protein
MTMTIITNQHPVVQAALRQRKPMGIGSAPRLSISTSNQESTENRHFERDLRVRVFDKIPGVRRLVTSVDAVWKEPELATSLAMVFVLFPRPVRA